MNLGNYYMCGGESSVSLPSSLCAHQKSKTHNILISPETVLGDTANILTTEHMAVSQVLDYLYDLIGLQVIPHGTNSDKDNS